MNENSKFKAPAGEQGEREVDVFSLCFANLKVLLIAVIFHFSPFYLKPVYNKKLVDVKK